MDCQGLPRAVVARGTIAWIDGDLRAQAGSGQYVERKPFPAVQVAHATWREFTAPRPVDRGAVSP
jgi:dihydropyrimidinase